MRKPSVLNVDALFAFQLFGAEHPMTGGDNFPAYRYHGEFVVHFKAFFSRKPESHDG